MPFSPLANGPPSVPHVVCRDGYYWAHGRTARGAGFPCAKVEARALTVAQVAATYEGDAQSRAAALASLTDGTRLALYPAKCDCGRDHAINVANLVRAYRTIAVSARPACVGLASHTYLKVAAIKANTPDETAQAQAMAAIAGRMGGGVPRGAPVAADEGR